MSHLRLFGDARTTWSAFWGIIKRHKSGVVDGLPRAALRLEPDVIQDLVNGKYKPKKHPGRIAPKLIALPERFVEAAGLVLREHPMDGTSSEAIALSQYLFSRKLPMEEDDLKKKAMDIQNTILSQDPALLDQYMTGDEMAKRRVTDKVRHKLHQLTYHWKPVKYDKHRALLYLVRRAAPEYAVLYTILKELKSRSDNFQPAAILDFGSGVGTVFWACYEHWGKDIKEYFAVDTSGDMNEIADLLVRDGCEGSQPIIKGTFFRQFLPASHTLSYDLVVSSYSFMELSSRNMRLQTLENLWSKTNHYLILIENGTNAGYQLIMEARDFILKAFAGDVHVFSPCSHDEVCPKSSWQIPCNFETAYVPYGVKSDDKKLERYSYLVLVKKRRPVGEHWPRLISPVLPRGGHVVCRMCCSDGRLKESVVTKSKHGTEMYRCARASHWGDLLPATLIDADGLNDEHGINVENGLGEEQPTDDEQEPR